MTLYIYYTVPSLVVGANNHWKIFVKDKKFKNSELSDIIFLLYLEEKARENPYPSVEGRGFVRVQI